MTPADTIIFLLLAAIWGSAFIFMRIITPAFGVPATAVLRMLIAGIALLVFFKALKVRMEWRNNFRHYLIVGIFNSGIPFLLFAFAALRLPAVIPAVVNSLTPLWGAVFAVFLLKEAPTTRKFVGLALGVAGVALIALRGVGLSGKPDALGFFACLLTPVSYGFAAVYLKRWASGIPARPMTAASLTLAGLGLAPFILLSPPPAAAIPVSVWIAAVLFGLLCTAFAFYLYFHLISSAGVTPALSSALVIPVFAFLWGYLFLGETISPPVAAGVVLTLSGTAMIIFEKK
jgi:drug/metabolite transporter (DMT)-like permease